MSPSSNLYAILKSDAYGHGIREVGRTLADAGCEHFAVESPQEGIALRSEGIEGEILLMNPIPDYMAELSIRNDLSVSVIHESIIQPLEDAAVALNKECKIHMNINVGLNRLGIPPSKVLKTAGKIKSTSNLIFQSIFGQPREPQDVPSAFNKLKTVYSKLKEHGLQPNNIHFANSATFLSYPETRKFGARIGILLYGVLPPELFKKMKNKIPVKPAMQLQTELVQIRKVPKGSKIGYRAKDATKEETKLGIIPLGYNHGLDRKYNTNGYALIRGKKIKFIGQISMNAATLDITSLKHPKIGEEVIILGKQNEEVIKINEIAGKSDTISAELMMRFGKGVARIHELTSAPKDVPDKMERVKFGKYWLINIDSINQLPDQIKVYDLIDFIKEHTVPYSDSIESISSAVDYALSFNPRGNGFVSIVVTGKKLVGAAVCVKTEKISTIPENILVYLCVNKKYRGRGIGSMLVKNIAQTYEGNFKIHINKKNPAINFLHKYGFTDSVLELRLYKETT